MRITERRLKKIIKESLEDEYKEKLLQIFKSGGDGAQQAIELANQVGMSDFLVGADLAYASLEGANLKGANLKGANLEGAWMKDTNLEGANLEGANLWIAWMKDTNLEGANLKGTNLEGANLSGTNLSSANLSGSIGIKEVYFLKPYKYDENTIWPEGFKPYDQMQGWTQ